MGGMVDTSKIVDGDGPSEFRGRGSRTKGERMRIIELHVAVAGASLEALAPSADEHAKHDQTEAGTDGTQARR